jgi:dihydrofolate reductase
MIPAPRISLVAALARNGVIGHNNSMPWHLPEDLKRFKQITVGHPVVMGRKTFDSILVSLGKPLPGRENIVISRSGQGRGDCRVVHSLEEAVRAAAAASELFVIGGAEIYRLAMPVAHRLYLTEIHAEFEGDTCFPDFDRSEWTERTREPGVGSRPAYDFVMYDRKA